MSIELLKEFAKSQGINVKEVDKFLATYAQPKTIDEVMALPHDLQEHVDYISYLSQPLKGFIQNEMWCERYMTIEVDSVVDCLYDRLYNLLDNEDDDFDIDEIGIENLETDDEDKKEKLEELKAIARQIVEDKFGSVVYDW